MKNKIIEFSLPIHKLSKLAALITKKDKCILNRYIFNDAFGPLPDKEGHQLSFNIGKYYSVYKIYEFNDTIHVQLYDLPSVTDDLKDLIGLRSRFVFRYIQNNSKLKATIVEEILKQSDRLISGYPL